MHSFYKNCWKQENKMPVYRYKTFEEADQALWNFDPDQNYFNQIHQLFIIADKLNAIKCQPGVLKYHTIEEAQEHRLDMEIKAAVAKSTGWD